MASKFSPLTQSSCFRHRVVVPRLFSSPARYDGKRCSQQGRIRLSSTSSPVIRHATPQKSSRVLQSVPMPILLRSLLVLSVAALPSRLLALIIRSMKNHSQRLSSSRLLRWPIEKTFYNAFCIGSEKAEISANVGGLRGMGLNGVILAFARETKFGNESSSIGLTRENQQLREYVAMNLETLEHLTNADYLALRVTGAGAAVVSEFENFSRSEAGSAERNASSERLKTFEDALSEICAVAEGKGVKVLIDAESSRHQAAIDHVALAIMAKFNRNGKALVYNTYQMYLHSTTAKVIQHIEISKQQDFTIGIKMVRGAFLHGEPDPSIFQSSKQNTDDAYDNTVKLLFGGSLEGDERYNSVQPVIKNLSAQNAETWNAEIMLATHNLLTVERALDLWRQSQEVKHVPNANNGTIQSLSFAQLMGMADEVSLKLVSEIKEAEGRSSAESLPAIGVYKYTIWGSFEECLLYLLRRAEENQDAVARTRGTAWEVAKEIGRRVVPV